MAEIPMVIKFDQAQIDSLVALIKQEIKAQIDALRAELKQREENRLASLLAWQIGMLKPHTSGLEYNLSQQVIYKDPPHVFPCTHTPIPEGTIQC